MFEIEIEETFAAAHTLPGTGTKCERLHGHNWKVQVGLEGEQVDRNGLLMDFHELRELTRSVTQQLDHIYLNEHPLFAGLNPTAENLARIVYEQVASRLARTDVRLTYVRIHETDKARATYRK